MADLHATRFPTMDGMLGAPPGWEDEPNGPCVGLPVMRRDGIVVSCWPVPWRQRLSILFGARIWLHVASGTTQPPVALTVEAQP